MAVNSFLAHIRVSDQDSGPNGHLNCSLNSRKLFLRHRYHSEYHLVTAVAMDREREDEFHVTMTCQDGGNPSLTSSMLFIVQVKPYIIFVSVWRACFN